RVGDADQVFASGTDRDPKRALARLQLGQPLVGRDSSRVAQHFYGSVDCEQLVFDQRPGGRAAKLTPEARGYPRAGAVDPAPAARGIAPVPLPGVGRAPGVLLAAIRVLQRVGAAAEPDLPADAKPGLGGDVADRRDRLPAWLQKWKRLRLRLPGELPTGARDRPATARAVKEAFTDLEPEGRPQLQALRRQDRIGGAVQRRVVAVEREGPERAVRLAFAEVVRVAEPEPVPARVVVDGQEPGFVPAPAAEDPGGIGGLEVHSPILSGPGRRCRLRHRGGIFVHARTARVGVFTEQV